MNPHDSDLKKALDLQAYADGELAEDERRRVELLLRQDPGARALLGSLNGLRELMRNGEPESRVEESREFYWSGIAREIERVEALEAVPAGIGAWFPSRAWWRWALPVGAAVAVMIFVVSPPDGVRSAAVATFGLNHEVVSETDDAVTFTFRSEPAVMSVTWVQGRHDF